VDGLLSDGDNSSTVNFTFSEAPTGFTVEDITVINGTLTGFSGSGTSYTATFTAADGFEGTGSVSVAAGSYTDAAGNAGTAGSDTVAIDTRNPTVLVDIVDASLSDGDNTSVVSFTFSEATTDFTIEDITVSNGTLSGLSGSGTSYTATFTANDGFAGTATVGVAAGSYTDAAGNPGEAGSDSAGIDTRNPTVMVAIVADSLNRVSNSSVVNFTLSEAATDFTIEDVAVSNGTLTGFSGSGTSYTATFTANNDLEGTGTVSVSAGSYTDAAGNAGIAGSDTVVIDTRNPTVVIDIVDASLSDGDNSSVVTFTFSEAPTGFTVEDITVTNGILSGFSGSGTSYSATFTANDGFEGTGTVGVAAASYTDAAGNAGAVGSDTVAIDTLNPAVTVEQAESQADPTAASPVLFTVVFSEAVTGFDAADVTLGGTAGATTVVVTGSGTTYTLVVSGMANDGTVTAAIAAGVAADAAGNTNAASTSTDNLVVFAVASPTVTINQATGQADPTNTSPINFTVVFSETVTGFDADDVILSGTAGATTAVVTGSGTTYNVAVSGMTQNGTVIAVVRAGAASNGGGHFSLDSTSTDNTVAFVATPPLTTGPIIGTEEDDVILIRRADENFLEVVVNGVVTNWVDPTALPSLVIDGRGGNDRIEVAPDVLLPVNALGGEGNDTILGGGGNDTILGGAGDDLLFGQSGDDQMFGEDGNDAMDGMGGNDSLGGGSGNDLMFGSAGTDLMFGEAGNDAMDGGADNDAVDGGEDSDVVFGSAGNDLLFGSAGNDAMDGGAGDDSMDGGAGHDFLFGLDGTDLMFGSDGNDAMDGGAGDDAMDAGLGNDFAFGSSGNDLIFGGGGNDAIDGNDGNDTIDAGDGDDLVFGSGGNDLIFAGLGDDSVAGGPGLDTIDGGPGVNLIFD
jgi:Ca2+-binding RTX toxin-like protein/citrate lyase beta subunit